MFNLAYSLALVALILTVILWYLPTFQNDFIGKFMENWISLLAFVLAVYWATTIQRRTPL
jgi:riboflavin transporter FmnP